MYVKKYMAGFIFGVILTLGVTTFADETRSFIAEKATFEIFVQGEKFQSEKPAVVIEGSTYLPLKATGEALGVDVTWNEKERRVEVGEVEIEKQMTSPAGIPITDGKGQMMASPEGIPLDAVSPIPTEAPTSAPIPAKTPSKGIVQNWYNFRSNIIPNENGFPMVTKDSEYYIPLSLFGQDNIIYPEKDGAFSVKLPGKEAVHITENNSVKHEGRTFVKLSSVGLQARIEGDTVYIEWAD